MSSAVRIISGMIMTLRKIIDYISNNYTDDAKRPKNGVKLKIL